MLLPSSLTNWLDCLSGYFLLFFSRFCAFFADESGFSFLEWVRVREIMWWRVSTDEFIGTRMHRHTGLWISKLLWGRLSRMKVSFRWGVLFFIFAHNLNLSTVAFSINRPNLLWNDRAFFKFRLRKWKKLWQYMSVLLAWLF
jgi:hypothetical protein